MSLVKVMPSVSKIFIRSMSLFWNCWIPLMAALQQIVFWAHSIRIWRDDIRSVELAASLVAPVLFWGTLAYYLGAPFIAFGLAPAVMIYLLAVEIVNFPHHLQLPRLSGHERLQIWDQHLGSRTCLYPRWFARHIVLNFNYHIEHHLFPEAPWYYLEDLQQVLSRILGNEYNVDPYLEWNLKNRTIGIDRVVRVSSGIDAA